MVDPNRYQRAHTVTARSPNRDGSVDSKGRPKKYKPNLMSISKYTYSLVAPELGIRDGNESVQYYAMQSFVEKHRKSKKKLWEERKQLVAMQKYNAKLDEEKSLKRKMKLQAEEQQHMKELDKNIARKGSRFDDSRESVQAKQLQQQNYSKFINNIRKQEQLTNLKKITQQSNEYKVDLLFNQIQKRGKSDQIKILREQQSQKAIANI
jgi:hypothetical protein